MMPTRLLYEIPDAGNQLSVSARTIERLVKDGEIASVKIGRRRLVPHDALEDYIDRLKKAS
jgi:excisionase family DNA binding protein